jgi:hypothetical protein
MATRYTPEQHAWLAKHYAEMPNKKLAELFNERFGAEATQATMHAYGSNHRLRKAPGVCRSALRVYTDEQLDFLRGYIPGHTELEIADAFAERFGVMLTDAKIGNLKARLGVRSGTVGGRFEKGSEPYNKGKKWAEFMSLEGQERARRTTFQKGSIPHNAHYRLLDEKVDKFGTWVYVRPRNRRYTADDWVSKQRYVWMQANGRDWPEGHRAVFADHDSTNLDPGNIVPVSADLYVIVTGGAHGHALPYYDRESLELAVTHARVMRKRADLAAMAPRVCGVCGRTFVPDGSRTRNENSRIRTCPECLAAGRRAGGKHKRVKA